MKETILKHCTWVLLQAQHRTGPMSEFEDTRVDVCLYFITPHNLRPVDIAMMEQIGELVPVIPVIAKVSPARMF